MKRPQGTNRGLRFWLVFILLVIILLWLGAQPVLAGMVWAG